MKRRDEGRVRLATAGARGALRMALLAVVAGGWCAHANTVGYTVITNTYTSYNNFGAAGQADYNLSGAFGSHTGAKFVTGPGGTATGTTDTSGFLTSSWDSATSSSSGQTASANAAADLAMGLLRASIATDGALMGASAYAQFSDTLHLTVAGAGPTTVTPIGVRFALDGTTSAAQGGYGSVSWAMEIGGGIFSRQIYDGGNAGVCGAAYTACTNGWLNDGGWASSQVLSNTPNSVIFEGTFNVTGANPTVDLLGELNLVGGLGQVAFDYSHTASFGLAVPAGVTYTSDSGVFLTETVATPEPVSWPLLLAALGGFCFTLRRRRA